MSGSCECSGSGNPESPHSVKIPFQEEQTYIKSKDRGDNRDSGTPDCHTSLEHSVLSKYIAESHDHKRGNGGGPTKRALRIKMPQVCLMAQPKTPHQVEAWILALPLSG